MPVRVDTGKSYKKLKRYLKDVDEMPFLDALLNRYGEAGVKALNEATPKDTGKTAASWDYVIEKDRDNSIIYWTNGNVIDGWFNVALMLQYGHATRNGGYVPGIDYINPALKPVYDEMIEQLWAEVVDL